MKHLNELVHSLIDLRQSGEAQITLLAVCPNSAAVLEAAVKSAAINQTPMLFAATLNQVDTDGGYTGWTPAMFVRQLRAYAAQYQWEGPLYPCLDHGGPWLKDRHTLDKLSLYETMLRVKETLIACSEAGYQLLHIDPTVDRSLPAAEAVPLELVVDRTVELMGHVEAYRAERGRPPLAYEVGTEEVHGGLVDYERFEQFLRLLRQRLEGLNLGHAWPCFIVAQVGTDLHTTSFNPAAARRLYETLSPIGSLAKGHYTDGVENPQEYPVTGMGGANVGPEFTMAEYLALRDLSLKEINLLKMHKQIQPSSFMNVLQDAVIQSGRWKKWLQSGENGQDFFTLTPERREWLVQTGARYIWTDSSVQAARQVMFGNVSRIMPDPQAYVVNRIVAAIDHYINTFNLFGSLAKLS